MAEQANAGFGLPSSRECAICKQEERGVGFHTYTPAGYRRPGVFLCWRCLAEAIDTSLDVGVLNQVDQWLWMRDNASRVGSAKKGAYQRPESRRKDTTKRIAKRRQAAKTGDR